MNRQPCIASISIVTPSEEEAECEYCDALGCRRHHHEIDFQRTMILCDHHWAEWKRLSFSGACQEWLELAMLAKVAEE